MLIVGLTGGIASGKSTVAGFFREAGAYVIDADTIVHQVMAPAGAAWQAIVDAFGEDVLCADQRIDRKKLGALVFADGGRRLELERIVHPHVRAGIKTEIARIRIEAPRALVVEDIPLLLETGMHQGLAEIIVVYVPESIQLQRLMQRDGLDRQAGLARIRAQISMEEKKRLATLIIDNSGSLAQTREQFQRIYHRLAARAEGSGKGAIL
jgi:dephospho-CoA kinase